MPDLFYRLKRKWNTLTTPCRTLGPGPAGRDKVSLVIYFDYEREFGHKDARESAQRGFDSVITALNQYKTRATWNCVGLIAHYYPETIIQLVDHGQEIASHTHTHINPLKVRTKVLMEELALSRKVFSENFSINLEGFHPPEDGWCSWLAGGLSGMGFTYVILKQMDNRFHHTAYCYNSLFKGESDGRYVLRIPSICDDWSLFSEGKTSSQMLSYWLSRLDSVKKGSVVAIGFHPWVLGKGGDRLQAFATFLDEVSTRSYIAQFTGGEIASYYKRSALVDSNTSE